MGDIVLVIVKMCDVYYINQGCNKYDSIKRITAKPFN